MFREENGGICMVTFSAKVSTATRGSAPSAVSCGSAFRWQSLENLISADGELPIVAMNDDISR
jgi:hypothetical protein